LYGPTRPSWDRTQHQLRGYPTRDRTHFDQYASADVATQHTIVNQLQQVMLNVIPVVPNTESVDW